MDTATLRLATTCPEARASYIATTHAKCREYSNKHPVREYNYDENITQLTDLSLIVWACQWLEQPSIRLSIDGFSLDN